MPQPRVLVVEDDPFTLDLLKETLLSENFLCTCVTQGFQAWNCLVEDEPGYDVVLLDRGLPDMDGLEILQKMKGLPRSRQIPVVVQTSRSSTADIKAGLQAGAYYYLVKPFSPDALLAILSAAASDLFHQRQLWDQVHLASRTMAQMKSALFQFQRLEEANDIAALLAKATPKPDQVVLGLAELMINAVEHGNLGIGYEAKSALLESGQWLDEINQRIGSPEFAEKWATLQFERREDGFHFRVCDQGQGFDWQNYLEASPERVFDLHGRGISISAKACFDRLDFRGKGNEVEAFLAV